MRSLRAHHRISVWGAEMMLALIDLLEQHGHARVYAACLAAQRGRARPLARMGLIGVSPAHAEKLLDALDRAELVTLARVRVMLDAIKRGQHAPTLF